MECLSLAYGGILRSMGRQDVAGYIQAGAFTVTSPLTGLGSRLA